MQVISGKYKGYKIKTRDGLATRPMIARMKEDAFNILNNYFIYDTKIGLDLFSGSGQLGIEALSRGLNFCYFNDMSLEAKQIIQSNLNTLKITNAQIMEFDYLHALSVLSNMGVVINLLLLDPPFSQLSYYNKTLDYCLNYNLLSWDGVVICETKLPFEYKHPELKLLKHKSYKNKHLYLFRREFE